MLRRPVLGKRGPHLWYQKLLCVHETDVLICQFPSCLTKNHEPSGRNNNNRLSSHDSGGHEAKIKAAAWLGPSEAVRGDLFQTSPLLLGSAGRLQHSLCRCINPVSAFIFTRGSPCVPVCLCIQISPLCKDPTRIGLGVQLIHYDLI